MDKNSQKVAKTTQKFLCKTIINSRGQRPIITTIKDKNGKVLTNKVEIMKRWKELLTTSDKHEISSDFTRGVMGLLKNDNSPRDDKINNI